MYFKQGITEITDELELKDFIWQINSVNYDWINNQANVEILMKIEGGTVEYSRTFNFPVPGEWTADNVLEAVLALPQFKGSTI